MKQVQITINVSDNKLDKLMDFLNTHFKVKSVVTTEENEIHDWQKQLVLNRLEEPNQTFYTLEEVDLKIKL